MAPWGVFHHFMMHQVVGKQHWKFLTRLPQRDSLFIPVWSHAYENPWIYAY